MQSGAACCCFFLQACRTDVHHICTVDQDVHLKGWQSYDAAVHCAAVSAATRLGLCKSSTAGKHQAQPMQTLSKHLHQPETAPVSAAWPASSSVQRAHSTVSTAASAQQGVQPTGITRDSLMISMQHTSKHRLAAGRTSMLPALLNRLHAGAKRPRHN